MIPVINKSWGEEDMLEMNEECMIKKLVILPNKQTSVHYHNVKDEWFYIAQGSGELMISGEVYEFKAHDTFKINHLTIHQIRAKTLVVIIETSTPEFEDVVRIG